MTVAPALIAELFAMTRELEFLASSKKMGATCGMGSISVCVAGVLVVCSPTGLAGNHFAEP